MALKFFGRRRKSVSLITTAAASPLDNLHKREVMYAWLQGSRIPFLLLSAVAYLWLHSLILSGICFLISIPLPWIAVVIANGKGEVKDPREKAIYKPQLVREAAAAHQPGLVAAYRQPELLAPAQVDTSKVELKDDEPQGSHGMFNTVTNFD